MVAGVRDQGRVDVSLDLRRARLPAGSVVEDAHEPAQMVDVDEQVGDVHVGDPRREDPPDRCLLWRRGLFFFLGVQQPQLPVLVDLDVRVLSECPVKRGHLRLKVARQGASPVLEIERLLEVLGEL